jgi:hypothetical protein
VALSTPTRELFKAGCEARELQQLSFNSSIVGPDLGNEIDNMEGLDVHRDSDGEIVLTMISDDNFSLLQRSLLLQFGLME